MLIQRPSPTPRLLLRNNQTILIAEASSATATASETDPSRFTAIGYRQTLAAAAKGGKANANGFRFRNGGMRALARTFRGKAFIGGHDWGDPRARAGDIEDAYAEEMPGDVEMALYFDLIAKAPWAVEGLANGTIDRFSFGVEGTGEITCTVHGVPMWSIDDCWCWPGEMVLNDDGDKVVAEWEYEGGIGLELSAVNVPAVDGTGIVQNAGRHDVATDHAALASLIIARGRKARTGPAPTRTTVAVPLQEGGSTPEPAPITMTPCSTRSGADQMDRKLLCKHLGLPETATDEEIFAKITATTGDAAQVAVLRTQLAEVGAREQHLAAERDASHVEAEISRLRATRQVSDPVVEDLRTASKTSRASFDSALSLVEKSAPPILASLGNPATRPSLQSDSKPTPTPGNISLDIDPEGPDAYEANRTNPNLHRFMRTAGITAEDVRKHGSRQFVVVPNIAELAANTAARGDRPGTGR